MYLDSIKEVARNIKLKNVSVLITGATGLIGSCIIDTLITANREYNSNITIHALGRSKLKLETRFGSDITFVVQNIVDPIDERINYDYIFHCASNADPKKYATEPVETILTNIMGTKNILDYCVRHLNTKMIFTSTFEAYGEIKNCDIYAEDMSGIIDQTVLRNSYPESKRCCEFLLRSYVDEYRINAVIARLPSVYGPTMQIDDSKAHAQFIRNAINHEDIVLKSNGMQKRTYCYVIDAVSALFKILCDGNTGETYNIANEKSVVTIAEVAKKCAELSGTKVVFDLPDEVEKKGFSRTQNCILDNAKLRDLGWEGKFSLNDGLLETLEYMAQKGAAKKEKT